MKIFIFSESAEAVELRDKARAEGHQAFIRNPQYFKPEDFDASCDVAYTDQPMIAQAFELKEKKVEGFPWKAEKPKAAKPEPAPEPKAEAPAPKRFARKK